VNASTKESRPAATLDGGPDGERIEGSSDRSFGLVFAGVFAVVAVWPLTAGGSIRVWAAGCAAAFLAAALARPRLLAPLNRLWFRFGLALGRVTTPIVMAVVFFLAVTPTGLVMRALGKDLLRRRLDPAAKSYWIERTPPGPAPATMINQF
jgi:hypothetical protein